MNYSSSFSKVNDGLTEAKPIAFNKITNATSLSLYLVGFSILLGVAIGLYLIPPPYFSYPYNYLSNILVYIYASSWSIRYYPQIILNFWRKSTLGLSTDTLCLTSMGFIFYSIYNGYYFIHPFSTQNSKSSFHGFDTIVEFGDLFFSIHAVCALCITIGQCFWYDGWLQLPQAYTLATISMSILFSAIYLFAVFVISGNQRPFELDNWLFSISIIALIAEIMRLLPQYFLNQDANIFIGIDLGTLCLDLTGGLASLGQILLDSYKIYGLSHIIQGIRGNFAKFSLGLMTIISCISLLTQFCMFRHRNIADTQDIESSHSEISNYFETPKSFMDESSRRLYLYRKQQKKLKNSTTQQTYEPLSRNSSTNNSSRSGISKDYNSNKKKKTAVNYFSPIPMSTNNHDEDEVDDEEDLNMNRSTVPMLSRDLLTQAVRSRSDGSRSELQRSNRRRSDVGGGSSVSEDMNVDDMDSSTRTIDEFLNGVNVDENNNNGEGDNNSDGDGCEQQESRTVSEQGRGERGETASDTNHEIDPDSVRNPIHNHRAVVSKTRSRHQTKAHDVEDDHGGEYYDSESDYYEMHTGVSMENRKGIHEVELIEENEDDGEDDVTSGDGPQRITSKFSRLRSLISFKSPKLSKPGHILVRDMEPDTLDALYDSEMNDDEPQTGASLSSSAISKNNDKDLLNQSLDESSADEREHVKRVVTPRRSSLKGSKSSDELSNLVTNENPDGVSNKNLTSTFVAKKSDNDLSKSKTLNSNKEHVREKDGKKRISSSRSSSRRSHRTEKEEEPSHGEGHRSSSRRRSSRGVTSNDDTDGAEERRTLSPKRSVKKSSKRDQS